MQTNPNWKLATDSWPGPDRARWHCDHDIVVPSPDGRSACVLYSCGEIRIHCECGLLTLLAGPPEAPTVLLQPARFTCFDFSPSPSAQWLDGSRFVVVYAYLYRSEWNRIDLLAFTFLDTQTQTFAHHNTTLELIGKQFVESGNEWIIPDKSTGSPLLTIAPDKLKWKPWKKFG